MSSIFDQGLEGPDSKPADPYEMEISSGEHDTKDFNFGIEEDNKKTSSDTSTVRPDGLTEEHIRQISALLSNELFISQNTVVATEPDLRREARFAHNLYDILNNYDRLESETVIPQYIDQNTVSNNELDEEVYASVHDFLSDIESLESNTRIRQYIDQNTVSQTEIDEQVYTSVEEVLNNKDNIENETSIGEFLSEYYSLEKDTINSLNSKVAEITNRTKDIGQIKEYYNKSISIRQKKFFTESVAVTVLGLGTVFTTIGLSRTDLFSASLVVDIISLSLLGLIGIGFIVTGVIGMTRTSNND